MVNRNPNRVRASDEEDGYILLAVVVMVAIVLIALTVAVPVIAKDVRRQKELESERRSLDYERAVRVYYRKNKSYPPNMDALLKGTQIRYLRRKWIDPLTGKDDWRLIHTPKTKTHFPFGEEIAGGLTGGLGSAAGLASPGGVGAQVGGTTTVGSTNALASGFGGATVASPTSGGAPGSTGSTTGSSSDTGMFGDSGGGPIYGVATSRTGDSILTPNQQTTYETWEFWYDPRIEAFYQKGNPMGGGGVGSQSATSMGQDATTGQSNSSGSSTGTGNGLFGSGSSSGTNGTNGSTFGNGGGTFGSGSPGSTTTQTH